MTSSKQRIPYYDVMKGILICMVILSHINYEIFCTAHIPNETIMTLMIHQWWYVSFYMPAFFVVTGICSSFQKPFRPFFMQNLRGILLPGIIFDFLFMALPTMIATGEFQAEFCSYIERVIYFGGFFWFLVSLFSAKIIYWALCRYCHSSWLKWLILSTMVLVGYVGYNYDLIPNYWCVCQTLDLSFFIGIGQALKNYDFSHKWILWTSLVLFALIVVVFKYLDTSFPYVAADYHIKVWWKLLVHPFAATSGTIATLYLCRWINSNRLLEFIGRGSLVIFMAHLIIMRGFVALAKPVFMESGTIVTLILAALLFIVVTIICSFFVWLFQQKYLRLLIGK